MRQLPPGLPITAEGDLVIGNATAIPTRLATGASGTVLIGGPQPSWDTADKDLVGLGNVDNTSDATKNAAVATLTNKTLGDVTFSGTATGFKDRGGQVYNALAYGAVGDGVTDDTTAINAAITAANTAAGGIVFLPEGTYATSAALTLKSNVTLQGVGRSSLIAPTGVDLSAVSATGSLSATKLLASNGVELAETVTLETGAVAAISLAADDYILLADPVSTFKFQVVRIRSIAGEVLTLYDRLAEPFVTANASTARKMTPIANARVENLAIDCSGITLSAGRPHGVHFNRTAYCSVADVYVEDALESGVIVATGYGNQARRITTRRCGGAAEPSFQWYSQSNGFIDTVDDVGNPGFGPQLDFSNWNIVRGVRSVDNGSAVTGRGFKFQAASHNLIDSCFIIGAANTGMAMTQKSHDNKIVNCEANDNAGAGFTCFGIGDDNNSFVNCSAEGNVNYDVDFAATGGVSQGNVYIGYYTNQRDLGTNNLKVSLGTANGFDVQKLTVNGGTPLVGHLSATAALNYGSIAAGAAADLTITVTGAAVGDAVALGPPAALEAGLVIAYWGVTAANTVTIRLRNESGSPVDPASATWRASVWKY